MNLGLNLPPVKEYSTDAPFRNMLCVFTGPSDSGVPWGAPGKGYSPHPNLQRSPLDYPLVDASAHSYAYGYPSGVYEYGHEGSGTPRFRGKARIINGTLTTDVRQGTTYTTCKVQFTQSDQGLVEYDLYAIDPADPPRNATLVSADEPAPIPGQVFRTAFLQWLQPYAVVLRFMDWFQINSATYTWQTRRTPAHWSQVGRPGVAFEHAARLIYELYAMFSDTTTDATTGLFHAWLNIPHTFGDNAGDITRMAELFHDQLPDECNVYLEWSNEIWQLDSKRFAQGDWLRALARADPRFAGEAGRANAYCCVRAGDVWRQVFVGAEGAIRPVLGCHSAEQWWTKMGVDWLERNYGPRDAYSIYGLATTWYFGMPPEIDQPGITAQQIAAYLRDTSVPWIRGQTEWHKQMCDSHGWVMLKYEGGQSLESWNGTARKNINSQQKYDAQYDPAMYEAYAAALAQDDASGVALAMHFSGMCKGGPKDQHWWWTTESYDKPSAKNEAMLAFLRGAAPRDMPKPAWDLRPVEEIVGDITQTLSSVASSMIDVSKLVDELRRHT